MKDESQFVCVWFFNQYYMIVRTLHCDCLIYKHIFHFSRKSCKKRGQMEESCWVPPSLSMSKL